LKSYKVLKMNNFHSKVLIIGSGPAGYSAAIYAARANLKPILVEGIQPGGQLTITTDVENYPGFAETIQGPWLMEQMRLQAEHVEASIVTDHIREVDFSKRPFIAIGESGNTYTGDSVIIATGAQAKWLGLESETKFQGFGVSGCATCDGFFYRNKEVVVVGGGNTAVEESLYLTHHAKKVTLIHRKNTLRAEQLLQQKLFANDKINVIWDHVVDEVLGTTEPLGVNAVRIKNVKTNEETVLSTDGVFIAIGHKPNTSMFLNQITTDNDGYIITEAGSTKTNIPGIFAAGDVQDKIYRQAITAAGTGCMAALEAEKFLAGV
jgi:thioredoxin reductase (NADPH)